MQHGPVRLDRLAGAAGDLVRTVVGDRDALVSDVCYDSRAAAEGALFFAVPGVVTDGHLFAPDAVRAGAAALVVERRLELGVPQVVVTDARAAMARMGAAFFGEPARDLLLVGVTGTNGKTTTVYLLESIFAAAGHVTGLIGTVETRVGSEVRPGVRTTPESLDLHRTFADMRAANVSAVAMEVTSHALALQRVEAIPFRVAGFTNLSQDHLDFHRSMEEYFAAKRSLFVPHRAEHGAVNVDDAYGRRLLEESDVACIGFGTQPEAQVRGEDVRVGTWGSEMVVATPGADMKVSSPLVGAFNVSNCLAACAVALQAGIGAGAIERGIAALRAVPGRFEPVDAGQPFTVVVDYAHTPASLDNVLSQARRLARDGGGRVVCVFGCGGDRDRMKRPLMGTAAARLADIVVVTSDNPRTEKPEAIVEEILEGVIASRPDGPDRVLVKRDEAIRWALEQARSGDVVVIAGKGHETGQEFATETIPFDDRDVARAALSTLGWGDAS